MLKKILVIPVFILFLFTANMAIAWACDKSEHELPPMEPGRTDESFVDDNIVGIPELYVRLFDLDGDGRVDYMTGRKIFEKYVDEDGNTFATPNPWEKPFPLFYWYDANGNGKFEDWKNEMWINSETDGDCQNIRIYNFLTD
ncbi:MAG: hypothetical protein HYW34_03305 [Candidatus Brennerbacteria bacterium]|nr:hypothetical protein [Candidatus Brennerbacteria bacterium]